MQITAVSKKAVAFALVSGLFVKYSASSNTLLDINPTSALGLRKEYYDIVETTGAAQSI